MADWSTWDGLNDAPEEAWEEITFGARPAATKSSVVTKPAAKKAPRDVAAFRPAKAIAKKQKAPRAAGLMRAVLSPTRVEENVNEEESMASDSPFIVDSKNPYDALVELTEAEEAAERAAAAAATAAAAAAEAAAAAAEAKRAAAAKKQPKGLGAIVQSIKENGSNTPVARRTRAAAKYITQTMKDVIAAVSPKLAAKPNAEPKRGSRLRAGA